MQRRTVFAILTAAWTIANAAPAGVGQGGGQLNKVPAGPIGTPNIPPAALDVQASFDFTKLPTSFNKLELPTGPDTQELQVPLPSYALVAPMYGVPERHVLRVFGITYLTPNPISFFSRPFEVAKRKRLTIAWNGAFPDAGNRVDMVVGIEGMADLARIAFQKGKVHLVTPQGFQPFATYEGTQGQGSSTTEIEHRVVIDCGAVNHLCVVTFTQNGKSSKSNPLTLASPTLLPTPGGKRRVYLRMTWPASEASSVHSYDFRRVTISGDPFGL